jgi:Holliday junction resolvase RusA-like endonuclease
MKIASSYSFMVPGIPAPGGSKNGMPFRKANGKLGVRMVEAGKNNKSWRSIVALAAHMAGVKPLAGPLRMSITFAMPRPKSHHRKNGELKPNAPTYHTCKPDTTKLIRSTEDALKGIAWQDDSQVAIQSAVKVYNSPVGAYITITQIDGPEENNV